MSEVIMNYSLACAKVQMSLCQRWKKLAREKEGTGMRHEDDINECYAISAYHQSKYDELLLSVRDEKATCTWIGIDRE